MKKNIHSLSIIVYVMIVFWSIGCNSASNEDVDQDTDIDLTNYIIEYHLDGGTNNDSNPAQYTAETEFEFLPPTKDGYRFEGWFSSNEFTDQVSGIVKGTTGTIIIYAKFVLPKITYYANGYINGTIPAEHDELAGALALIRNVTGDADKILAEAGFNIYMVGWNTQADGSGTRYLPYEPITMTENDLNLYIQWSEDVVPYTSYDVYFSYNGNMQTGGSAPNCYYYEGDIAYIADKGDLVKTGFTFICWNTQNDGNGTDLYPGLAVTVTTGIGSMDLYAKWVSD